MAESEEATAKSEESEAASKLPRPAYSFSIWPPTGKTRDAVRNRLIETLSAPSILSKRYGAIPHDEAVELAKRIEEEAFNAVGLEAKCEELEILHMYSKEVSKRMLEMMKSRSEKSDDSGSNFAGRSFDLNVPVQADHDASAPPTVTDEN